MSLQNTFRALSDRTRRDILSLLKNSDLNAGEIAEQFAISKPSISHHLNILKQADLVTDKRQGQNIYYSLNTSVLEDVLRWFLRLRREEEHEKN